VSDSAGIEARGLAKSYGEQPALRGIDLSLGRGQTLVCFGPNGAGKTTLLKILATLMKPSAGSLRIGGLDGRQDTVEIRRLVSLVGHPTFLYDDLTVEENLRFYGRMYAVPELERRIGEVADRMGLASRRHDRVGQLSHGLQRRATLARACLHDPAFFLLDEPETGLDPGGASIVGEWLAEIKGAGRTVVMVTHDLARGLELGDSIIVLHRGKICFQSPRAAISAADFPGIYHDCIQAGGSRGAG
jgi:heme exporter protein A